MQCPSQAVVCSWIFTLDVPSNPTNHSYPPVISGVLEQRTWCTPRAFRLFQGNWFQTGSGDWFFDWMDRLMDGLFLLKFQFQIWTNTKFLKFGQTQMKLPNVQYMVVLWTDLASGSFGQCKSSKGSKRRGWAKTGAVVGWLGLEMVWISTWKWAFQYLKPWFDFLGPVSQFGWTFFFVSYFVIVHSGDHVGCEMQCVLYKTQMMQEWEVAAL